MGEILACCTGCGAHYALREGEDYFCFNCHANMAKLQHVTESLKTLSQEWIKQGLSEIEVKEALMQASATL